MRSVVATNADAALGPAAELLRGIGHPVRLAILQRLEHQPGCVHELMEELEAPQPLVSQHLKVLRSLRLVSGERRGREVVYSLADHHVAHIVNDAVHHAKERPDD